MTNRIGRTAAIIAGTALASAVLVFTGANPASAPEIDATSFSAPVAEVIALDTEVAPVVASYQIETAPVSVEVSTPNMVALAKVALEEALTPAPAPVAPTGEQITAIGDSLMVGATPFLEEILPGITIDGRVGRPMPEGMNILDELGAQGEVRDYVVLGLATNAGVTVAQFDKIIEMIGPDRTVVMVNAYGDRSWIPGGNEQVEAAAAKYPGQIVVADWNALIGEHPEYIGPDGIHANKTGQQAYAQLVQETLNLAAGIN